MHTTEGQCVLHLLATTEREPAPTLPSMVRLNLVPWPATCFAMSPEVNYIHCQLHISKLQMFPLGRIGLW